MRGRAPSVLLWALLLSVACSNEPGPVDAHGTGGAPGDGTAAMPHADHDAATTPVGSGGAPASQPHTPSVDRRDARDAALEDAAMHVAMDAGVLDTGMPAPNSPTAVYSVDRYDGDLTHITIYKRDPAQDVCVLFSILFPAALTGVPELELPPGWGSPIANAVQTGDETCSSATSTGKTRVMADSSDLRGRVAWVELDKSGGPCSLDIDVTVTFMPTGRIPAQAQLFAEKLAVPCGP